jgi:hypothetical protein
MSRKQSARPDEDKGFLVQCPICHALRDKICMVRERLDISGEIVPAHPAGEMHAGRIALGWKWWDWHKGITHHGTSETNQAHGDETAWFTP